MEALIELVAASFARHGIECPGENPQLTTVPPAKSGQEIRGAEPILAAVLPQHNFGKSSQVDPTP
jgi:hypothetical protein